MIVSSWKKHMHVLHACAKHRLDYASPISNTLCAYCTIPNEPKLLRPWPPSKPVSHNPNPGPHSFATCRLTWLALEDTMFFQASPPLTRLFPQSFSKTQLNGSPSGRLPGLVLLSGQSFIPSSCPHSIWIDSRCNVPFGTSFPLDNELLGLGACPSWKGLARCLTWQHLVVEEGERGKQRGSQR